ncbi:NAD(P) transhydrogenase subunit alpha [candidate division KSB1 bacterium]|nr:NAD(P) transhydrogenase subunit alpha [candidate division KSB1 bacterium]RQW05493.1 MAG: NAD(P) transhydrogenase subunit alpha [candidate division KSB1 bacterium]
MTIGVPKEILADERRVAATPETIKKYVQMGFKVLVESKAGDGIYKPDSEYQKMGAEIVDDVETLYDRSDVILKVKQPIFNEKSGKHEVDMMKRDAILITFLHPAAPTNHKMVKALRDKKITAFTMDSLPRTLSYAQTMDALTSMSTITGYRAILMAAENLSRFVPVIATAIGATKPAKILIIGAGIVGMQAIATAKRLGGIVTAVDIRPEAREQAMSLGAKIGGFEVPQKIAEGKGGYAQALPEEWLKKEVEAVSPLVKESDIIVSSALVPGEEAPILITREMVQSMRPGSYIVDVAIDQGGNCEITQAGKTIIEHHVTICGTQNIPGSMPEDATWLYANNIFYYVENLFKKGLNKLNFKDEVVKTSLVTHKGKIVHHGTLKAMAEHKSL